MSARRFYSETEAESEWKGQERHVIGQIKLTFENVAPTLQKLLLGKQNFLAMSTNTTSLIVAPTEVLTSIFVYLENNDLASLSQTCKKLHILLVSDSEFWQELFAFRYLPADGTTRRITALRPTDSSSAYRLCQEAPFDRNLHQRSAWVRTGRWSTEPEPVAPQHTAGIVDLVPEGVCDVTSYTWGTRTWALKLADIGLSPAMVDTGRILARVSEWYVGRNDCGSRYFLSLQAFGDTSSQQQDSKEWLTKDSLSKSATWLRQRARPTPPSLKLLDSSESGLLDCPHGDKIYPWRRHELELQLPVGTRWVVVHDGGKDQRWWAGFYGAKICSTSVILSVV
ncbi:hypothetical protein BC937DRAFT_91079 [Endogone sp. FLAS-F59071]|nr:hypothetical protein BC937DRAFT_91079 [Endogone sp. FLAS-F59071]|eukprot:RUS16555.1 hypothetical protein BC937DRAFT_91079 [Endogone sp. FLAS-F59071]